MEEGDGRLAVADGSLLGLFLFLGGFLVVDFIIYFALFLLRFVGFIVTAMAEQRERGVFLELLDAFFVCLLAGVAGAAGEQAVFSADAVEV